MELIENLDEAQTRDGGFIVDPFNRRWHLAHCPRVTSMTTGERKWFAQTRAEVDRFLDERVARYATAKPIDPCPTCRPDGSTIAVAATPPRPSRERPASTVEGMTVRRTAQGFVATTSDRVTFGPRRGSAAARVRARLCELLPTLGAADGDLLHAVFGGRIPVNSDVENQLIYNVFDGPSTSALSRGVRFELDDADPRSGFEYRYELAPAGAPFRHWREGPNAARWTDVLLPDGSPDALLSRTWWALHAAPVQLGAELPPRSRFGLRLTVRAPVRLTPERLKRLIDGVVCAFQQHDARPEAVRRIAARLTRPPAAVTAVFADAERVVLGAAERPIGLTREDVQWNPDDTRLVAAEIRIAGESPRLRLAGSVFGVER